MESTEPSARHGGILIYIARRLANSGSALLVIAYMTLIGLLLAERGREHLPVQPFGALWQAAVDLALYIFKHPATYSWNRQVTPVNELLGTILARSFVLLTLSLAIAALLGLALGFHAALSKSKTSRSIVTLLSVLGISTPSFLLGMMLWVVNIQYYRLTGNHGLPAAGFGWDGHMVMPTLVLAMRPMAQIAQVTYVTLSDVLGEDYIRTATAKGLPARIVRDRHALRNILIPVLTTIGTSLRFSLASLPVVELFFDWPGIGLTLIEAIQAGENALVVDLILSLGLFFLLLNSLIETLFPLLDPRLLSQNTQEVQQDHTTFIGWWRGIWGMLTSWVQ
ncbi:MAG: ABC transporter permease subunit, partial [Bacteroidota bacterium]